MKKSGAFLWVIFLVVVILGIAIYSFFATEKNVRFGPSGSDVPLNCSQEAIKDVWDFRIRETTSTGINISTNTSRPDVCENYYAWKQVGDFTYILAGFFQINSTAQGHTVYENSSGIAVVWGNYTTSINLSTLDLNSSQVGKRQGWTLVNSLLEGASLFAKNWSVPFVPEDVISSKFNYENEAPFILLGEYRISKVSGTSEVMTPTGSNFTTVLFYSREAKVHSRNQTAAYIAMETKSITCYPEWSCTPWGTCNGTAQNRTCYDQKNCGINYGKLNETQNCSLGCVSNWTALDATPCNATESFVIWYNDTNRCPNAAAPANITGYCDYDQNNLIGRLNNIKEVNLDINILKIDNSSVNYSKSYTGLKDVKLIEDDGDVEIVRVGFKYDFDDGPLNLARIKIEKQSEDDDFGYLIVGGLSVANKEFRIDKVHNSNVVCIKDNDSIGSIGNIDGNCDGDDEHALVCPGKVGGFNCTDGGSGTYLVKGLDNSGVRELNDSSSVTPPPASSRNTTCQPIWDCGQWGICTDGFERRVCTDYSSCPNVTKVYNETRPCTLACVSDWNCGNWTPENCGSGEEQTQNCVDSNGCGAGETRTRDCAAGSGGTDWMLIGIVVAAAVVVLAAIVLIIIVKRRKDEQAEERSPIQSVQVSQRPPAGAYNSTHYGGQGFGR